MRIIIVGCGQIGYYLAENLIKENHDITVIERDEETFKNASGSLDAFVLKGDGSDYSILQQGGVKQADILIAVTNDDNTNIISGLIGRYFGVEKSIVRINKLDNLTNPLIVDDEDVHAISPQMAVAREVIGVIITPIATDIDIFAEGKVEMLRLPVLAGAPIVGKPLVQLPIPHSWIFIAHMSRGEFSIPYGNTVFSPGDTVIAMGNPQSRGEIEKLMGLDFGRRTKKVVMLGGGNIGTYVAEQLQKKGISVRVIEANRLRAKDLANQMQRALVMRGDGTTSELLDEAGISKADFFAALSGRDEVNILGALLAKHMGAKRVLALSQKPEYSPIIEKIGIDTVVSPRLVTAGEIYRFLMRKEMLAVSFMEDGKGQIFETIVDKGAPVTKKALKDLNLPRQGLLIGALIRNEELIIPRGEAQIKPGDRVVIFALPQMAKKVENFFLKK